MSVLAASCGLLVNEGTAGGIEFGDGARRGGIHDKEVVGLAESQTGGVVDGTGESSYECASGAIKTEHGFGIGISDIEIPSGSKAGSQAKPDSWPKLADKGAGSGVIFQDVPGPKKLPTKKSSARQGLEKAQRPTNKHRTSVMGNFLGIGE